MEQEQRLTVQKVAIRLLQTVQALFQSGEITIKEKNKMSNQIKEAVRTSDFSEYTQTLLSVRFASYFKTDIDDDLNLIKSLNN